MFIITGMYFSKLTMNEFSVYYDQTEASWTFLWLWYQTLVLSMVKCWFPLPPKWSKLGWLPPSGSLGKLTSLRLEVIGAIRLVVRLWYAVLQFDWGWWDWDCCWCCWNWDCWCAPFGVGWFLEDKMRLAIWIHLEKRFEYVKNSLDI